MFELIEKMFIRVLTVLVSTSNSTNYVSLSNQKCMTQPTLINLHSNEYSQKLHYYPFAVNDLSNKVCVRNKTEDLNLCST